MDEIDLVPIGELKPAPYNPRTMDTATLQRLMKGIDEFGLVQPIVANRRSYHVVGGHQRLEALAQLGRKVVPVIWVDLDDAKEKALNLALNKLAGDWDDDKLRALLAELEAVAFDTDLTGFNEIEVDELLAGTDTGSTWGAGGREEPETPDPPADPITKPGDLIQLGDHWLLCGDSTDVDAIARLYRGATVDVILTDPPYCSGGFIEGGRGQGSVGRKTAHKAISRDNLSTEGLMGLIERAVGRIPGTGCAYVFADWRQFEPVRRTMEAMGYQYRALIVWDKQHFGMGGPWRHQHELIFFGTKRKESNTGKAGDVIGCKRTDNEHHTTQKPVELLVKILENTKGKVVADPFAGSGSTILACQETKRTCYAMELDPAYCDVIVERWQKMTGREAIRHGPATHAMHA